MEFLCGQQRKAVGEVEAHLVSEHAFRAGAGAVAFHCAVLLYVAEQIQVLLHCIVCFYIPST